ncbi:MAG: hypothetical protein QXG39_04200 [Candidatus Aenigmatarchaeota archaeon]
MLEALLLLFGMLAAAAIGGRESDSNESKRSYESYERIRVYPSQRKAVRYYDGNTEEYYY